MATRTKKKRSLAWRIVDAIITLILVIILIYLVINAIMAAKDSTYTPEFFGHQLYSIVTDSMEPLIPVGSLVSARSISKNDREDYKRTMEIDAMENLSAEEKAELKQKEGLKELPFGTIIMFNATTASGHKIVVTHYFAKFENGHVWTYPEQFRDKLDENGNRVYDENGKVIKENYKVEYLNDNIEYDNYQDNTTIDDIRAIYSWHVPGVGSFLLFLKTKQALAMYAVIAVIILCGYLLIKRVNKKEEAANKAKQESLVLNDSREPIENKGDSDTLSTSDNDKTNIKNDNGENVDNDDINDKY